MEVINLDIDSPQDDIFNNKNRNQINIGIVGAISAGKSTLLNTIFAKTYSHCKIKRTTMTPQIYYEYDGKSPSKTAKLIKEENKLINNNIISKTEKKEPITLEDIKETKYIVPKVHKFIKLVKDNYITIYDIPGLNDARTRQLYFEYLDTIFYKLDIILFVVDINSALNTSDEIDILTKIIVNCKKNYDDYGIHNKLIVIANKCDEMFLDDANNLQLEEELDEMKEQIINQVEQKIEELFPELEYSFQPLSSEDSYIYRILDRNPDSNLDMKYINKFGYMEFGRTRWNKLSEEKKKLQIKKLMADWDMEATLKITGFNGFSDILNRYLRPENQKRFVNNHIIYDLQKIIGNNKIDITNDIQDFYKFHQKYKSLDKRISSGINGNDIFIKYLTNYLDGYKKNVISQFVDIILNKTINAKITIKTRKISIKEEKFIPQIEEIKIIIDNILTMFTDPIPIIEDLSYIINHSLTDYYRKEIDNKIKPVSTLYNYIKSLIGYNVQPTETNINNFFENPDILNSKPEKIIDYINNLEQNNLLNEETKLSKILDVMIKIYKKLAISHNSQDGELKFISYSSVVKGDTPAVTGYTPTNICPSYVYFTDKFWTKFIMFNDTYDPRIETLAYLSKVNCSIILSNKSSDFIKTFYNNKNILVLENYFIELYSQQINNIMKSGGINKQKSESDGETDSEKEYESDSEQEYETDSESDGDTDMGTNIDEELGLNI